MSFSKMAHSVKNPKTIHYVTWRDGMMRYLCNGACSVTKSKITKAKSKVTCKNCLREIRKFKMQSRKRQ
jgi:hypothetical protein